MSRPVHAGRAQEGRHGSVPTGAVALGAYGRFTAALCSPCEWEILSGVFM